MNDQSPLTPARGAPEDAHHNYYGVGVVGFALRVGSWCLQAVKPRAGASARSARVPYPAEETLPRFKYRPFSEAEMDRGRAEQARSSSGPSSACVASLTVCTVLLLTVPGTNLSAKEQCAGAPVEVTAPSSDERRFACSAASDALGLLARCGISVRRPLRVEIRSEVRHPFSGSILGLFDIKQDKVLVTQEVNVPSLVNDTPYAKLPQRDFYRSVIVHEVIHGVMHQNLKRPAASNAVYEYPAYALQIESLAPSVREQFLQSFEQGAVRADILFNDSVLMFDPFFFAAQAYRHFKGALDGCTLLHGILGGDAAFIAPGQM